MLIKIYPENPNPKEIAKVVACLKRGGVVIYPTDTVYALGCSLDSHRAFQKLCTIKGMKPEKANFSLICPDMSHLSEYAKQLDNATFKLMKRALPGPFTFILPASGNVPKIFKSKKKTIGIRIPNHTIPTTIARELGNPLVTTSIHDEDDIIEYTTDPELIYEKYRDQVDLVIDGGYGNNEASTVLLVENGEIEVIREGIGNIEDFR